MTRPDPPSDPPQYPDELFRLMVNGAQDYAIFLLDPTGMVSSWNVGARRIKGYEASEIIGQHFSKFYPQEAIDRGWPEHELVMATREGRFEDENWRVRKDGTRFWANVVITALRSQEGELRGFSKITRDLTERRRHEVELRRSEERFRLLLEGVQDYAIFMLDPEGFVRSWNVGAARIGGYTADEVIGLHFSRFYPGEALALDWPNQELEVAARSGRSEDEGWRVRKDGTQFWGNTVITALREDSGELRGFANVTRDMTDKMRVQTLEQEGRHMNEFLAMLGHELRNPLAPIHNAVAILKVAGTREPMLSRSLDMIERQVGHLGRLVDDLLDTSRITRGKISLEVQPLQVSAVLARAAEAAGSVVESRGQTLTVVAIDPTMQVTGDPVRLSQVVVNLLGNASKFTPHGGHLWLSATPEDDHAAIRVRDDGIGISAELLPRIFDLFTQGERSLDRAEGGLGIGLTLVRQLVHLHGGTVEARSEGTDRGSEFIVRLPLTDTTGVLEDDADAPLGPIAARFRRRVLVVDDNVDVASTLGRLLELWGHDVSVAHDGQVALDLAHEVRPEVVFLDLGLPGLTGFEVAERLRHRGDPPLLVAVTGYGRDQDRQRSREAGFSYHLVKPVAVGEIRSVLDRMPIPWTSASPEGKE